MQLAEHHLQADAYILFEKLMEHVKCWYLPEKENQKGIEVCATNSLNFI